MKVQVFNQKYLFFLVFIIIFLLIFDSGLSAEQEEKNTDFRLRNFSASFQDFDNNSPENFAVTEYYRRRMEKFLKMRKAGFALHFVGWAAVTIHVALIPLGFVSLFISIPFGILETIVFIPGIILLYRGHGQYKSAQRKYLFLTGKLFAETESESYKNINFSFGF